MSAMSGSSCFCIICYKPVRKHSETVDTPDYITKFVKNVNRFVRNRVTNTFSDAFIIEKLQKCCTICEGILERFTENYHELKLLELKLESLLDKLVEKINYANRVPARWIHVNRVLEETFQNDLDGKAESQNRIRKFRQNVIEAAHQRKLHSKPRVLLKRVKKTATLIKPTVSNTAAKYVCPKCGKRLGSMKGLEIHLEHHKNPSEWKWKCTICEKRLSTKQNLEVHFRTHTRVRPFKCRFCGEDFRYRGDYTKHLKTRHTNESGVEKELKRKWIVKPDHISVESSTKIASQDEYQSECIDDMDDDWVDYSGGHNDILVDPDENNLSEDCTGLDNSYDENPSTSDIKTGESAAVFRDPQIQIKLEHSQACYSQIDEVNSFPFAPNEIITSVNLMEDPITQIQQQPIQEVIQSSELNQCVKCGKILKTAYGLQIHMEYHRDPKDWKYGCKTCGKNCATRQNLETHMKIHKNNNSFKCHYCGESYRNGIALRSHLLDSHGNDKGTRKEEIGRGPRKLVKNMRADNSLNENKVISKVGEILANGESSQQNHRYSLRENRVTGFVSDEVYSDDDENFKERKLEQPKRQKNNIKTSIFKTNSTKSAQVVECEVCTRKLPSFLIKENHFKICHDLKGKSDKEILTCGMDNCTAYFLTKYQLSDHHKKEHRIEMQRRRKRVNKSKFDWNKKEPGQWKSALKFECKICKGMYPSILKRDQHFKKFHDLSRIKEGASVEKCGVGDCTAYFLDSQQLNLHRWLQHYKKESDKNKRKGREKNTFECGKCGKCFTKKNSLHVHLLYHHDRSGWKFKCEICGKKSPTKFKLGEHVRTHTKETPYQCRFCGKRFRVVNTLSRHLKLWHKKEMDGKGDGKRESFVKKKNTKLTEIVEEFKDGMKKSDLEGKFNESALETGEVFEGDDKRVLTEMGLDKVQDENDKMDEIEGRDVKDNNEKNLLTWKGDCFGDGTLVEFEDLD